MAFTRKFLTDHGVPEDQVDAIMAERNRTLTDYVPKTDVQSQVGADHQPGKNGAQRHGDQRRHGAAEQGVQQGLPQNGLAQLAGQHVFPIV